MNKLAVSKDVPYDATDLDFPIEKNIKNIAESKNKDLTKIGQELAKEFQFGKIKIEIYTVN